MPNYEYVCSACRHRTETIHGVHDPGPRFCPECGAEGTLRKAVVAPAIHFKGSGWAKKERRSGAAAKGGSEGDGQAAPSDPAGTTAASGGASASSVETSGPGSTSASTDRSSD